LAGVPRGPNFSSALIADLLALGTVAISVLAAATNSYILGACAGFLIALNVITAHNFLHQKDNFRMYYFNLSFMSFRYVVPSKLLKCLLSIIGNSRSFSYLIMV
jgi:hypothetical protein